MFWIGTILILVSWLWIAVNGFRKSVLWGLGCLLVPLVGLIFAVLNFAENKIPLLLYVAGIVLFVVGGGVAQSSAAML